MTTYLPPIRSWPPWVRHLASLIFFIVLVGIIYFPVLTGHAALKTNLSFPSGPLFVGDPIAGGPITMPLEQLVTSAWAHFRLPIVDPYQAYGLPLLATQSVPVFPPEILMHLLLPNNYSVWNMMRLIILSFGSYLLASSIGQSMIASLAVGTAASLVGFAPPNVNMEMLNPVMVLPFVLLALRYLLDPNKPKRLLYWVGLVTAVVMLALSGFQEVLPLELVITIIFVCGMIVKFSTLHKDATRILLTGIGGAFGVAIGSIGILPTLTAINQGMGSNQPTAYLTAVPKFWLATLTIPRIAGAALTAQPQDFGQTVWTLGTPVLGVVVLLAIIGAFRYSRDALWFVIPSTLLVGFGILEYANTFGILKIFDIFPFDPILMIRFLQFAWWLPWCLLLGFVITIGRKYRVYELIICLFIAVGVDIILYLRFDTQLRAGSLAPHIDTAHGAVIFAIAAIVVFIAAILISHPLKTNAPVFVVFALMTVILLPSNLFPASGNAVLTSVVNGKINPSSELVFAPGFQQLPSLTNSVQVYGPVMPNPYRQVMNTIAPPQLTSDKEPGTYGIAPSLYFAKLTKHLFVALRSLGVNEVVSMSPLSPLGGQTIPTCAATTNTASNGDQLCYLGKADLRSSIQKDSASVYSYLLRGVDPIVARPNRVIEVTSNKAGLQKSISAIKATGGIMPKTAYLTHPKHSVKLADNTRGISRVATTESVVIRVSAKSSGLVILRDTYLPGMTCAVNGQARPCRSVDGGLWVAVRVPGSGVSSVSLNYTTQLDIWSFRIGVAGLSFVSLLWLVLAAAGVQNRRRTRAPNRLIHDRGAL
ncbi:hypothetical protein FEAC_09650 [Ferrimicrobium acidiphilum DSM 19497]|uniref:Bacterial membrane protein YfhO n=1 Tax=Ferrimicrobium acidiphilum DSM 19497 TaxID=1121877 RepID=A0A0D8FVE5_9ACTN|nr:hypothetical protein [Ferrimicrobium acidiphilum]KJE77253.1 hypothetical protein FEAC_09650 [Ferrimicrobium acidiphilum DSM 19497]